MWTIPNALTVHQSEPFVHSNNVFIIFGLVLVDILNVYFDCESNHDSQTHICNVYDWPWWTEFSTPDYVYTHMMTNPF